MMESTTTPSFTSPAWLLVGLVNSLPGQLSLQGERLTYLALDSGTFGKRGLINLGNRAGNPSLANALLDGEPVTLFDIHLSELEIVYFPWWYFEAGMKTSIKGKEYRFSFVRPQNTQGTPPRENLMDVMENGLDLSGGIGAARAIGKRWKELLTLG